MLAADELPQAPSRRRLIALLLVVVGCGLTLAVLAKFDATSFGHLAAAASTLLLTVAVFLGR